jgi:hypothetical protein
MFRQILIELVDADFQRILWQSTLESWLQHFRFRTVTYDLAPAPYLAVQVFKQLAIDNEHLFPVAVLIVESSIYVDDMLFGYVRLRHLYASSYALLRSLLCPFPPSLRIVLCLVSVI